MKVKDFHKRLVLNIEIRMSMENKFRADLPETGFCGLVFIYPMRNILLLAVLLFLVISDILIETRMFIIATCIF